MLKLSFALLSRYLFNLYSNYFALLQSNHLVFYVFISWSMKSFMLNTSPKFSFIFLGLFLCFQHFEYLFSIDLFNNFLSAFFNNFLVIGEIDLLPPSLQWTGIKSLFLNLLRKQLSSFIIFLHLNAPWYSCAVLVLYWSSPYFVVINVA